MEREHALDHGAYALVIFTAPMAASAALEALVALRSDGWDRRRVTALGLLALAAALALCALATSPWALSAGLGLAGAASGVACAAAQAELIARTGSADRALSRWTIAAWAGDLVGPAVVAAAMATGASFRWVLGLTAVALAVQAGWVARAPKGDDAAGVGEGDDPEDASEPIRAVLSSGAVTGTLLLWLLGAALCSLLDELAAALAALRMEATLGATEAAAGASLLFMSGGGLASSLFLERAIERLGWRRVLGGSAAAAVLAALGVALAPTLPATWAALALLGAAVAPHYGVAKARAYEAVPGRPGLVNATAQLFVVLDLAAPWAVGLVADRWGLAVAFVCLSLQPVGLLGLAAWGRGRG